MILIDEILISDAVVDTHFVCDLKACKGACCIEGDYGAPLENDEIEEVKKVLPILKERLSADSLEVLDTTGPTIHYPDIKSEGTPLLKNGACIYLVENQLGIATCGFEQLYHEGLSTFRKPISCHLYPIRVTKNDARSFEALNYDKWEICSAACTNGKKKAVLLYEFAKEAIISKYGVTFYDQLDAAAKESK